VTPRERSFLLISTWMHSEAAVTTETVTPEEECHDQIRDLGLVAASLLRCWAKEAGIPPHILLTDLALGQALEETPSPEK